LCGNEDCDETLNFCFSLTRAMHLLFLSVLFSSLLNVVYCRDLIPEEHIRLSEQTREPTTSHEETQNDEEIVQREQTHARKGGLPEKEIFIQEELVWVSEDYTIEYGVVSVFVDKPSVTIKLPDAYSNHRRILYISNKSSGFITIIFWVTPEIHTSYKATIHIKRGETKMFQSDGNEWILINL